MRDCKLRKEDGVEKQFAICPKCNNPVTIVGFYQKYDAYKASPHGRHRKSDVPGLANYNQEAYDWCPLAKPQEYTKSQRISDREDILAKEIKTLLANQFDRVIYLLQAELGLKFSRKLQKQMLDKYISMEGHLYRGATLENIPWIFAYMSNNHQLYGRHIKRDGLFYQAVKKCGKKVKLGVAEQDDEYVQVLSVPNQFLDLNFCFTGHKSSLKSGEVIENMKLSLYDGNQLICQKRIVFDTDYFFHLIHYSDNRYRNYDQIRLAKELLGVT